MNVASRVGCAITRTAPNLSFFHSLLQSDNATCPLDIFRQILDANSTPNDLTFSLLIKSCVSSSSSSSHSYASSSARLQVTQIQTQLLKRGINHFVYVYTALIDSYMKLGFTTHARQLFEDMTYRDVVSWNVLICGYSQNDHPYDALRFFLRMLRHGFTPNKTTMASLLPSCSHNGLILQGRSIHGFGIKAGLASDPQLSNALTSMYAKCDDLEASQLLFEEMDERNVVSWNTMIAAYGQNGFSDKALFCFKKMLKEGLHPSPVTMMNLLSANVDPETVLCYIIKWGINDDAVVTSLVCLYAKQGFTDMAKLVYNCFPSKRLICLTAIVSSYSEKGDIDSAIECFIQTLQLDIKPDAVALISVLHGVTNPSHFAIGCALHGYGLKSGLTMDYLVANGLISLYSRFDEIEAALSLFVDMSEKPLTTWNSVISGCVQAGKSSDAIVLFCKMNICGQKSDGITIASLLSGCCQLGNLGIGETLHGHVLRNDVKLEDFTRTALIDMYTKCGRLDYAEKVFHSINDPCLATWNSIISGYSLYGLEHKAFGCYSKLQEQGLKPDKITFLGVLAACTHGGLVSEGIEYFRIMTEEHGLMPGLQHYACIVGLLGRASFFEEAIKFIDSMKIRPDSAVWGALLSACCIQQEIRLGECLAKKLFFLNNKNGGFYVLMSNLYAIVGRWGDVARVRDMMRDTGGDGSLGVSVIER